jgi:hypothetical protein
MESKPIKNVSLSYACEKNWNDMAEVAGGRFCDSCQHVVHDFTNQSDCQLKKILQQNSRVCGRFRNSQMSTHFLKYAAATVIAAATGVAINSCAEEDIAPSFTNDNLDSKPVNEDKSHEFYTTGIIFVDPKELEEIESDSTENSSVQEQ